MARPTTKHDLIEASDTNYKKLINLLDSIPSDKLENTFNFDISNRKENHWKRDKNIRDVLIHLYEWHQLMLDWINSNQQSIDKPFLKEGYNWKTYGSMNEEFVDNHKTTTFPQALELFTNSHHEVMKLADTFTSEELFSKNVYPWVGGSTLGSYFVSATARHYDWAYKKLNLHKKSL